MSEFCFEDLDALHHMPHDLYIAYHIAVNALHWIWDGLPMTYDRQTRLTCAHEALESVVRELSDESSYESNLDLMYQWVRQDVESRKKLALERLTQPLHVIERLTQPPQTIS